MELKIYNQSGALKLIVSTSSSSSWNQELMMENAVSASFTHPVYVPLDVNDYILLEGVKFSIKKEYKPKQKNRQTYSYSVKFYAPIHDAEQVMYLNLTDGQYEPQFSLDGSPREHLQKWVENMNRVYGEERWHIGDVIDAPNETIEYSNTYCWDALSKITEAFGTEWWEDGFYINLCRCERGERVSLGYLQGLTSLTQTENTDDVKFFTRLIPLGSTKNIDRTRYGFSRLQLPNRAKYIDRNTQYGLYEHVETDAFAGIFPHYTGTVAEVRTEEKIGDDGKPFTIYYFKDTGMAFDPCENEIAGLVKHVSFQTGDLTGRDFEANYHPDTKEWEIINTYPDEETQIPGGNLIPRTGDTYIPWNFRMPVEYETQAEKDYKAAVDNFLAKYSEDIAKYGGDTDYTYIIRNAVPLLPGQSVRLLSEEYFPGTGYRDTRMTKVVRKLDNLSIATIECTNQVGKGWRKQVDDSLNNLQYVVGETLNQAVIDVLKTWDGREPSNYNVFSALRSLKEIAERAISKIKPDGTPYPFTIGHSARFGDFLTGISGGYIDKNGGMEMDSGVFRKRLFVPEIAYNRTTYFKGRMVNSPGGGCTVKEWTDNGDGSYTVVPELTDADGLSQFVDDILTTYFTARDANGKLQAFEEMKFRVTAVDYNAKTFVMTPKPGTAWKPGESMVLAQTGNFTDTERQTYILIDSVNGNNCITFYDNANTWDAEPAQEKSWFGKKKGRTVHGIPADNYSAVLRNIIMSGKIFQVDDITGEAFRVPLFKGAWQSGTKYAYYDEVTHDGSSWMCVNPEGTTSEPSDSNTDWLKYVSKGDVGKDGTSITNCGDWHTGLHVPYMGLVKMAERVFICTNPAGTDNPPMWTITDKDGNRLRQTQDGGRTYGYIITGKFNTAEYELLVENGKDGRDGTDHEWIFKHTTDNVAPATPGTSQVDDYVPDGWHDDAMGVSESLPYEWACSRTKKDGVWSAFTPAALWAKFGFDGESFILADIDNEMDSVALTYEGLTTGATILNTTVSMWYGTEKLPLKAIACAVPVGVTANYNVNTGVVTLTVAGGAEMPERSQVKITVTAAWQGVDYSRELVFTIAGVRAGSPGADAVLYRLVPSVSSVSKRKDGTYSVASVSCTRTKSAGGNTAITTDGVLKYSKDCGAEVEIQNGTAISPGNFTSSLQFVYYVNGQVVDRETVPMVVDGSDGEPGTQGVPGIPGKDGKILYTWIRYADDANGGGISNNPAGKKFLGMAYNKESAVESDNPEDYRWSNIKGEDGIGVPGADGKTYYTWVAYSDNADGSGMYQQPNDNTRYIGIAINKETSVESNNPADYTWSKFRGDDGKDGKDGTSITNCGTWHTGMHVPYMGLVKMAGRVFLCMNPAGTSNPPMWTITDKDGNRLLQTQDGGRTYGYILTGELNTAEWELLVENGKDGRDGTDHEWIFKHTTDNVAPPTPGTAQVDDYVPDGWHDDAIGVSESLPYEWACSRTKKDGVWSAFTPAALWAKFGFDGESVILADIDNEMDSVALTHEGRTTASTVLNATVGIWYGTEKLPLKAIACATPAGVTASYNVNTGVVAMTVAGGVSMPERSQVRITVTATWQGADYSRDLVFTIAGVRAGSPGADAVLYRLVPSVSSVSKRKDGTYSVASVSCTRTKSVDGNTAITTDGVLKYSKDGGAEVEIQNGTAISPRNFTSSLQFIYYVNGQVVDRETVPMVVDGNDGHPGTDGTDGTSIKAGGEWRTANTPVAALTICTMGGRAWLSKVTTSNPPMWTITDKDGNRLLQTQDGGRTYGYILTGELNTAEWELLASDGMMVYLTSTVSNIRVSSAGSLVPSGFKVYAKRTFGSATLSYPEGYLVARGYSNGIWSVVAGPSRSSELTVNASAGYSTFSVRCYQTQADAAAWNDNFIAEQSVGVSYDGERGKTGAEPRPRGLFASDNTYVWNDRFHDIVLATFNDRTIPFRVRAYGASVTVAPSSIDGDANWEPAQQFQFVATDLLLSRQIRADEIYTDDLVVQNVLARDKEGNVKCKIDGNTGDVDITGIFNAIGGIFKNISSPNGAFKITEKGDVEIVGQFSTAVNGTRITIDPSSNSIKLYNQNNNEVGSISFMVEEWNGSYNYYPRIRLSTYHNNAVVSEVGISASSINTSVNVGSNNYSCNFSPQYGLRFYKNSALTKSYPAS